MLKFSPKQIAEAMGIPYDWLISRAESPKRHYRRFGISKASGGSRTIWAPDKVLARAQRWIANEICNDLPISEFATAYRPDFGIRKNALAHKDAGILVRFDLTDFFESISRRQVIEVFERTAADYTISKFLTDLCTVEGHLPQGSPASPVLSNLVMVNLDSKLDAIASRYRGIYTRYADDMCFSLESDEHATHIWGFAIDAISTEGFKVNSRKSRIFRNGQRKPITGLILGSSGVGIGRAKERAIRAMIHNLQPNQGDIPSDLAKVKGFLAWVADVDATRYDRLNAQLAAKGY